jgi:DNA ligase 1
VPRFPSFVGVRHDVKLPPASTKPIARVAPPRAPAPPREGATEAVPGRPRRFEYVDGSSSKFWEVTVAGNDMTVHFGRIGTAGQTKTKSFADSAAAAREAMRLVAEKVAKGCRAVG